MDSARSVYSKFLKAIPKTYSELREFFEKERPDWLQTLMPTRINAPSVYWPQKVLAVATVHAAMHNQVAMMLDENRIRVFQRPKARERIS